MVHAEGIFVGQSKSQRTILSEDGELRTVDVEGNISTDSETTSPDTRASAIFCCNCGTANKASSRFCHKCGQSLEEQMINPASLDEYAPPEWKNKRSGNRAGQGEHLTPQEIAVMIEVMTLLVMGVLCAVSIATQQTWIALVIFLGWIAVKLLQRRRPSNP